MAEEHQTGCYIQTEFHSCSVIVNDEKSDRMKIYTSEKNNAVPKTLQHYSFNDSLT